MYGQSRAYRSPGLAVFFLDFLDPYEPWVRLISQSEMLEEKDGLGGGIYMIVFTKEGTVTGIGSS